MSHEDDRNTKAKFRHTVHAAALMGHLFLAEGHKRAIVKEIVDKSKKVEKEKEREQGRERTDDVEQQERSSGDSKSAMVRVYMSSSSCSSSDDDGGGGFVPPPLHKMASQLKETQNELEEKEDERKRAIEGGVERIRLLMGRIDDLKKDLRVTEAKRSQVESENNKLKEKIAKREAQIISSRQKNETLEQRNKDLASELEDEKNRFDESESRFSPLFKSMVDSSRATNDGKRDSDIFVNPDLIEKEEQERRSKVAYFMTSPTNKVTDRLEETRLPVAEEDHEDGEGGSGEGGEDVDDDEKGDVVPETSIGPSARSSFASGAGSGPPPGNIPTHTHHKGGGGKGKHPAALARGTSLSSIQESSASKIQRLARGFLGRVYVHHLTTERMAEREGIMVAYRGSGTRQGEAGWYVANNQLYYFAMDKGEYVLVCGPVTETEYDYALSECINRGLQPRPQYRGEIEIDRIGLVALRFEIARYKQLIAEADHRAGPRGPANLKVTSLIEELRRKEGEVEQLQGVILDREMQVDKAKKEKNNQIRATEEIRKKMKYLQVEMTSAKDAYHMSRGGGMHSLALASSDPSNMTTSSSPGPGSPGGGGQGGPRSSEFALKLAILGPLSPLCTLGIIKLQAAVRAFVVRSRNKQKAKFERATTDGVLTALKGTKQGHSGWYRAPDGKVYYFILKDEEWVMTAGPLSMTNYHELFYSPYDLPYQKGDKISPIGTPTSSAKKEIATNRPQRKTLREGKRKGRQSVIGTTHSRTLLRRAMCELQVEHPFLHGDLFVDKTTKSLYMAVSVDQLVRNSLVVDPNKDLQ